LVGGTLPDITPFTDALIEGIKVNNTNPVIRWENGQGNIADVSLSPL
jgi:hypothetical protein